MCLCGTLARRDEHHPQHLEPAALGGEAKDRPTAADFDVVGVSTEREDPLRPISIREQTDSFHDRASLHRAAQDTG